MNRQKTQVWDAEQYAGNGRFVAELAGEITRWLQIQPGERVLDLGCGDGALTAKLVEAGAEATGVELDPSMAAAARSMGLHVMERSMTELEFTQEFDAVFSNAALHWVRNQDAVLDGVRRALRPKGRFVAEMGGLGNIASIRVALSAICGRFGVDSEKVAASYFPSAEEYRVRLEAHGFAVERMELVPRPTLVTRGMAAWLRTFRRGVLEELPEQERDSVVNEVECLLRPALQSGSGLWYADYVRLRFAAVLEN